MTPKLGPVKIKVWRKFLEDQGLKHLRDNDGHELWSRKDLGRPITFQPRNKDIPGFHIISNLKTLDITVQQFLDYLNGKPEMATDKTEQTKSEKTPKAQTTLKKKKKKKK